MSEWVIGVLFLILLPAAIFDYKNHKIPNVISLSGWIIGPVLYAVSNSLPHVSSSIYGFLVMLGFMLPFYVSRWMGAGDVKLMAGVGALVGIENVVMVLLGVVITGAVMGVLMLMYKKLLTDAFRRYGSMLGISMTLKKPVYLEPGVQEQKLIIPYAIPIAIGTFLSLWLFYIKV